METHHKCGPNADYLSYLEEKDKYYSVQSDSNGIGMDAHDASLAVPLLCCLSFASVVFELPICLSVMNLR